MTETFEEQRAKLVKNERSKLAATFFNNIAVAFIAAGVIVPQSPSCATRTLKPHAPAFAWVFQSVAP